jgi:hypothetical protein
VSRARLASQAWALRPVQSALPVSLVRLVQVALPALRVSPVSAAVRAQPVLLAVRPWLVRSVPQAKVVQVSAELPANRVRRA